MSEAKKQNMVFMGTTVLAGRGVMVVQETGAGTRMGEIAESLREQKEEKTPLQKKIAGLARFLAIMVAGIAVLIFLIGTLTGRDPVEMFTVGVAVAVAAIPEGLAVALTAILAIGMQRILKRKALVRKLIAAETLGSVTLVASDKTGTLTEGKMSVSKVEFTNEGEAIKAMYFANGREDPLEIAIDDWLDSSGTNFSSVSNSARSPFSPDNTPNQVTASPPRTSATSEKLYPTESMNYKNWKKLSEQPFDPEKKYQTATVEDKDGNKKTYISGAPEVVLEKCLLSEEEKYKWKKKIDNWGSQGLRIVGLAMKRISGNQDIRRSGKTSNHISGYSETYLRSSDNRTCLTWLGLIGIEDPVRESVAETVEDMHKAGIKLKIVTGDYLPTARAVWEKIKAQSEILKKAYSEDIYATGSDLENWNEKDWNKRVQKAIIFARVSPQQKLKIVKKLREKGEVVAIFGDGVNDAPALKAGDIGVVVNEAADTAKETADIVLLDSDFRTIIAAIEEGRGIYENIKKVALYLLSDSFAEITLIVSSLLLSVIKFIPLPVTAAQILWVNLISDGFPNLALTVEPKEEGILNRRPTKQGVDRILNSEMISLVAIISSVTGIICLLVFTWYLSRGFPVDYARTVTFTILGTGSIFYVFSVRSLSKPLFSIPFFSNPYLVLAVIGGLILQLSAIYLPFFSRFLETVPLRIEDWGVVLAASGVVILMIEMIKYIYKN